MTTVRERALQKVCHVDMDTTKVLKLYVRWIANNGIEASRSENIGEGGLPVEGVNAFALIVVIGRKTNVEFGTDQAITFPNVIVECRKRSITPRCMKPQREFADFY